MVFLTLVHPETKLTLGQQTSNTPVDHFNSPSTHTHVLENCPSVGPVQHLDLSIACHKTKGVLNSQAMVGWCRGPPFREGQPRGRRRLVKLGDHRRPIVQLISRSINQCNLHKSLKSGLEVGGGGALNTCRKGRPCSAAAGGCTTPPPVTRFPFCTCIALAESKQSTDESG